MNDFGPQRWTQTHTHTHRRERGGRGRGGGGGGGEREREREREREKEPRTYLKFEQLLLFPVTGNVLFISFIVKLRFLSVSQ